MNKNLLKIGALALGMFSFGLILNGTSNAQETGDVTLTINTGESVCNFSGFDLGAHSMDFDTALTISGNSFETTWNCTDRNGGSGNTWTYEIYATTLSGSNGGTIAPSNVSIKHGTGSIEGSQDCIVGTATGDYRSLDTTYTILERKAITNDGLLCSVSANDVNLQVEIPANQVPGEYLGNIFLTTNGDTSFNVN